LKKTIIENEEDREIVRFSSARKKVSINIFGYYEGETHSPTFFLFYDHAIFLIFCRKFDIEQKKGNGWKGKIF